MCDLSHLNTVILKLKPKKKVKQTLFILQQIIKLTLFETGLLKIQCQRRQKQDKRTECEENQIVTLCSFCQTILEKKTYFSFHLCNCIFFGVGGGRSCVCLCARNAVEKCNWQRAVTCQRRVITASSSFHSDLKLFLRCSFDGGSGLQGLFVCCCCFVASFCFFF